MPIYIYMKNAYIYVLYMVYSRLAARIVRTLQFSEALTITYIETMVGSRYIFFGQKKKRNYIIIINNKILIQWLLKLFC